VAQQELVPLRLTQSEAELLRTEMRNALECGATDPDFGGF
jgi:hypothetical protein